MQLKAFIKKKAEEKKLPAQIILQNYIMERFLKRISISPYKQNFILKGGFLIAAIVGIDSRATMDLDTTAKGFLLSHESIRKIFEEICTVDAEDDIKFTVLRTTDIREDSNYPCLRVSLVANYPPLSVPLTVDVTIGDKITPREIEYSFKLMFDERNISIMAYNLETILAEKLETVLSRNIANTRPRDFYDIHILYTLRKSDCEISISKQALRETALNRGSLSVLAQYREAIGNIQANQQMQEFWKKYCDEYNYAKGITFSETCETILSIMEMIDLS